MNLQPGRRTSAAVVAAALVCAVAATTAAEATGSPTGGTSAAPSLDQLAVPFARPGFKEQEFDGALLVGEGQTRFSLAFDMVSPAGKIIDDNMVPYIKRIGPVTPDGSYYEIDVSTDDGSVTAESIGALKAMLAHPEDWTAAEVAKATTELPKQEAAYDAIQKNAREIRIRYSVTGAGEIVGSATALTDDTTVYLQASAPWSEPSSYTQDGAAGIVATSTGIRDANVTGNFRLDSTRTPDSVATYASVAEMNKGLVGKAAQAGDGVIAQKYTLAQGETVAFHAQTSTAALAPERMSTSAVTKVLDHARTAADDGTIHGQGPTGQAATYMRDAMALNDNWDEKYDRSFVMWGWGGGGDDIFLGWDSGWDAITELSVDPATALDHIRDFYDQGGPRYDQLNAGPMHAYAAWRAYTRTGDTSILELVYPVMAKYIARMPEFDTDGDGLLESPWAGERQGGRGNHLGLDDSPQYWNYQEIDKVGGSDPTRENTNMTDVALNSYYGLLADTLARMAQVLGDDAGQAQYTALHRKLYDRMNARLWNSERGMYLNRYLDGSWEPTVTPTVFYPLFGGLATPARAASMVRDHLENPAEFGGDYVIPSVARNDPAYCAAGHTNPSTSSYTYYQSPGEEDACEEWQGAVWPPMNATVYDGLKRYGLDDAAAELADKSTALWLTTWKDLGWFPEYWDSEPGQVFNSAATTTAFHTYSWSNLMPLMSTSELIGDEPWGDAHGFRFGSAGLHGTNTVSDVPLKGHLWSVTAGPKKTTLQRDGATVVTMTGGRGVARDAVIAATGGLTVSTDAPLTVVVDVPGGGRHTVTVRAGTTQVRWTPSSVTTS